MRSHGTASTYILAGCRCPDCTRANTAAHRERVTRRRLALPLLNAAGRVPHGTEGGYSNYGCRCPACAEARRQYMRARRARTHVRAER